MTDLIEIARRLQTFCDQQQWQSCFIGGIAVQRWGELRMTRDGDVTLLTGFGREHEFIDVLLSEYQSRVEDPGEFALKRRVLLLLSPEGVGIDISLGALPFEEHVVQRATNYAFAPGLALRICSAEDLVVLKLFASRPIDIRDAEGVVLRNKRTLDWSYIESQLVPLVELKEEPEILDTLARLRRM